MKECCKINNNETSSELKKYSRWFIYSLLISIVLFVLTTSFVKHGDETPHGGIIVHATNGYNVEKVRGFKRVFFYLLSKDEKTTISDKMLTGTVEFMLKDGTKESHSLTLSKDTQTLKFIFKEKKKIKNYLVRINYKRNIIVAKFN